MFNKVKWELGDKMTDYESQSGVLIWQDESEVQAKKSDPSSHHLSLVFLTYQIYWYKTADHSAKPNFF
jgi:hypothetical protein